MKIVLIGGSGLIGTKLAAVLEGKDHDVISASRSSGVNVVTGEGLAAALRGANVVVDVLNSPSLEPNAVLEFFRTTSANLVAAGKAAGVKHHVVLSIVGADRMPHVPYMDAKVRQEELVRQGGVSYTVVRATQFFELAAMLGEASAVDGVVKLPPVAMRPIAADDVAAQLAEVATSAPRNATLDLAGPEVIRMDAFVRRHLAATGDRREVVADPTATYFGFKVDDRSLVPAGEALLGHTTFDQWLASV